MDREKYVERFDNMVELIWTGGLESILTQDEILPLFVKQRKSFEGWLKVEMCRILSRRQSAVVPEKNNIDITTPHWAIELKTVPTNYGHADIPHPHAKRITRTVDDVLKDVYDLKQNTNYSHKMVLFVAYPLDVKADNYQTWQYNHLNRIKRNLIKCTEKPFSFRESLPGAVYFGLVE